MPHLYPGHLFTSATTLNDFSNYIETCENLIAIQPALWLLVSPTLCTIRLRLHQKIISWVK
jgi:hypothetical protein